MKYLFIAAALLATPAIAADAAKPPPPVSVTLTANEVQVVARALRMAASQCGPDREDGCAVGLNEKAIDAKLQAAVAPKK